MNIVIFISTLLISIDSFFYGIYEFNKNKNHFGGFCIFILSIFSFIFTNIIYLIK